MTGRSHDPGGRNIIHLHFPADHQLMVTAETRMDGLVHTEGRLATSRARHVLSLRLQ